MPRPLLFANRVTRAWPLWLILTATAFLYAKVSGFTSLNYDDDLYIFDNPFLRDGINSRSLIWCWLANLLFFTRHAEGWIPLTLLTRLFDTTLYGNWAGGHHITSLLVHLANVALVWRVCDKTLGLRSFQQAVVTGLWALLAVQVEPVAWLSARKELLGTFFCLLTLLSHSAQSERPGKLAWLRTLLCYLGVLLSKPAFIFLPLLLPFLASFKQGRWKIKEKAWVEIIPLLVLAAFATGIAYLAQAEMGALQDYKNQGFGTRFAMLAYSPGAYVWRVFDPWNLAIIHPSGNMDITLVWQALGILTILGWFGLGILAARRGDYRVLCGLLFFILTLLPGGGLVTFGQQITPDRYLYLPSLGVLVAFLALLEQFVPTFRFRILIFSIFAAIQISALTLYLPQWRDVRAIWLSNILVSGPDTGAYLNLGAAEHVEGRLRMAEFYYRRSITMQPGNAKPWKNLELIYRQQGRETEASQFFEVYRKITSEQQAGQEAR